MSFDNPCLGPMNGVTTLNLSVTLDIVVSPFLFFVGTRVVHIIDVKGINNDLGILEYRELNSLVESKKQLPSFLHAFYVTPLILSMDVLPGL